MCRTYRRVVAKDKSHHKNAVPYSRTEKHKSDLNAFVHNYDDYKNK